MNVTVTKGPHFEKSLDKAIAYVVECAKRDLRESEKKKEA